MLKLSFKMTALLIVVALVSKIVFLVINPFYEISYLLTSGLMSALWGVRFDAAVVAMLLSPLVLFIVFTTVIFKRTYLLKTYLSLASIWIVLTTAIDATYMIEAGRHITFEVFTGQGMEGGLVATAVTTYFPQTITALILVVLFLAFVWFIPFQNKNEIRNRWSYLAVFIVVWSAFAAVAIRGGLSDAPQSPMSAYKIGTAEEALIAWSAPYSFTYYLAKGPKNAASLKTPAPILDDLKVLSGMNFNEVSFLGPTKKANVVVVLLESWVADDIYSYSKKVDAAPNFDKQRSKSLTTEHFYADGYRTVEGIFATFCSYPNPIGGGVAGTQLQALEYKCLPKILKDAGWNTAFIQGSGKGIVGAFAQSLGFVESFGKTDFAFEGIRNYWGYMDDDIYRFSLEQIKNTEPPFLITINTGTTHDTYLPNESDYVFGNENRKNSRRSAIHHADAALGRFLNELPKVLNEPTLVILVADHTAGTRPVGLQQNAIPFLMFATDGTLPLRNLRVSAGQLDIAPTVVDWLGGNVPWFTGQSLLKSSYDGFAYYSAGQSVNFIKNKRLVRFDVTKDVDLDSNAFCFKVQENGIDIEPDNCEGDQYIDLLKEAQAYTRYTQGLLFEGKTYSFDVRPE